MINDLPDYGYCLHCGRVISWDDYSYVHLDGWADCRMKDDQSQLNPAQSCQLDVNNPINPQPTLEEAYCLPILNKS